MSATKSVVALAIARLLTTGKIPSFDQPVHAYYPEWKQGRKRDITLRMLMQHTSGLQNVGDASKEIYPAPDIVQLALAAELDAVPGTAFSYNNKAVNLLAGIVRRASGLPLDVYVQRELFAPMGIVPGDWMHDRAGLYGPEWRTLVSREMIARGLLPDALLEVEHGPVVGWSARGYLGQAIIVVPAADLVAVRQVASRDGFQDAWNYAGFPDDVIALARALAPASIPSAPASP